MSKQTVWLLGAAFTVFILNYASVRLFGYPFAWCWGDALLRPVLASWASLALLFLALVFLYSMWRYGVTSRQALNAVLLMFLVGGASQFAETLFKLKASCE